MAVLNYKSTVITNRDATPKLLTDAPVSGGGLNATQGYVTSVAADSIASTYRLCQVPSNARVDSVRFQCAALGASTTLDVGVYYPTYIPAGAGLAGSLASTAISQAFFASAIACTSAVALTEVTNESLTNTIDKQEMPLWQALGLTTDPGIALDIVATATAANASGGLLGVKVAYAL